MRTEVIVAIVLVALAAAGLVWLELHSRRNSRNKDQQEIQQADVNDAGE